MPYTAVDTLLVHRLGLVAVYGSHSSSSIPDEWMKALDIEAAKLGFALTYRVRSALSSLTEDAFTQAAAWLQATLASFTGANQNHTPLFRKFPERIPKNIEELWLKRFLGFYFQPANQPCLWCNGCGNTHILSPCHHIVCDACFDGSNYSGCPICERKVDSGSPFFQPTDLPTLPVSDSPVPLRRIDLAENPEDEARTLCISLVSRVQAMSPTDVAALTTIVSVYGLRVLPWLPPVIPVRQNVANVFGTLFRLLPGEDVFAIAAPHLRTATDLLRVIAVWSGVSAALDPTKRRIPVKAEQTARWAGEPRRLAEGGIGALPESTQQWLRHYPKYRSQYLSYFLSTDIRSQRFKPPKISRAMRRTLLDWLNTLEEANLFEDMTRHGSVWVRIGEALHTGEYADRYPRAARAFQSIRRHEPRIGFAARAERLRHARDTVQLVAHLRTRPGELWRRADDTLRHASDPTPILEALSATVEQATLPILLQLAVQLPRRSSRWPVRVYFPAGAQFVAPSTWDNRAYLPSEVTAPLVNEIEHEILKRLARLPAMRHMLIDTTIADIVVPFNERTAAKSAITLPRGSIIHVPDSDSVRLFLHWCEPIGGEHTDIDLSVAFYNKDWEHTNVCSYYSLNLAPTAVHSGDWQNAPPPDGASEFVDIDRVAALAAGHRYAVMVVNAYSGLPFGKLERGFAGIMRRTSSDGPHFDPATVELKFDVAGDEHGIYVPLVFDLETSTLTWLDVCSAGELSLNNVASSNKTITRIVPSLLNYFGHHVRPSMFDLAVFYAAARTDEVWMRGATSRRYTRRPQETKHEFLLRLRSEDFDEQGEIPSFDAPILAMLLRGDVALPEGSVAWALFRDQLTNVLAASDLLTVDKLPS